MHFRVVPDNAASDRHILANLTIGPDYALLDQTVLTDHRIRANHCRVRDAARQVTPHVLGHVLVKRRLHVDHLVVLIGRGMEHREIDNERVALPRDDVLRDDLVCARVRNLTEIKARRQNIRLGQIIRDLARVQLHNKVFFECFQGEICLEVREN